MGLALQFLRNLPGFECKYCVSRDTGLNISRPAIEIAGRKFIFNKHLYIIS